MPNKEGAIGFHPVDKERIKESLNRLWEIYLQIGETATAISCSRCPYKNVSDCCTAHFKCRNQARKRDSKQLPLCTGSDDLNYRNAWEV